MRSRRTKWTAEQNETIRVLSEQGASATYVAEAVGSSRRTLVENAVWRGRKRAPDSETRNWSPEQDADALRLYGEGLTPTRIAVMMGRTTDNVKTRLDALGVYDASNENARSARDRAGMDAFMADLAKHHASGPPTLAIPSQGVPYRARNMTS